MEGRAGKGGGREVRRGEENGEGDGMRGKRQHFSSRNRRSVTRAVVHRQCNN